MTYRNAGVDVTKMRSAQQAIGDIISVTHAFLGRAAGKVLTGFGHYAGLIKVGSQILAMHADGVGTKVMVAQMVGRFDTIGIDCIAMNVNDVICVGAEPVGFIDYIALKQTNEILVKEIARGLVKGAKASGVAIVGGETAILPDLIAGDAENAFDLAGMVLGVVYDKPIMGDRIRAGDIILGVESSGLHSNGYTLARKVLLSKYSIDDTARYIARSIGEELLEPTRIYVKPMMEILKGGPLHGIAHITGGSFSKLARLNNKVNYNLDSLPEPYGIFKQIQLDGRVSNVEMYKTFNMGIGLCIVVPKARAEHVSSVFERYKMRCYKVGQIDIGNGSVVARISGRNESL